MPPLHLLLKLVEVHLFTLLEPLELAFQIVLLLLLFPLLDDLEPLSLLLGDELAGFVDQVGDSAGWEGAGYSEVFVFFQMLGELFKVLPLRLLELDVILLL